MVVDIFLHVLLEIVVLLSNVHYFKTEELFLYFPLIEMSAKSLRGNVPTSMDMYAETLVPL